MECSGLTQTVLISIHLWYCACARLYSRLTFASRSVHYLIYANQNVMKLLVICFTARGGTKKCGSIGGCTLVGHSGCVGKSCSVLVQTSTSPEQDKITAVRKAILNSSFSYGSDIQWFIEKEMPICFLTWMLLVLVCIGSQLQG